VVKLVHRPHEADVPLLDQIKELQSPVRVLLGDGDDEPEVRLDHVVAGLLGDPLAAQDRARGGEKRGRRRAEPTLDLAPLPLEIEAPALQIAPRVAVARAGRVLARPRPSLVERAERLRRRDDAPREGADLDLAHLHPADRSAESDPGPRDLHECPAVGAAAILEPSGMSACPADLGQVLSDPADGLRDGTHPRLDGGILVIVGQEEPAGGAQVPGVQCAAQLGDALGHRLAP